VFSDNLLFGNDLDDIGGHWFLPIGQVFEESHTAGTLCAIGFEMVDKIIEK
jgi:hypothetical protein